MFLGSDSNIIGQSGEEDQHDGVSEDEEDDGCEGKDNDNFFPEAELHEPGCDGI